MTPKPFVNLTAKFGNSRSRPSGHRRLLGISYLSGNFRRNIHVAAIQRRVPSGLMNLIVQKMIQGFTVEVSLGRYGPRNAFRSGVEAIKSNKPAPNKTQTNPMYP